MSATSPWTNRQLFDGLFGLEDARWLAAAGLALVFFFAITVIVDLKNRRGTRASSTPLGSPPPAPPPSRRRAAERWTLPVRALVLLALGLALARPWWTRTQTAVSAVVLFDTSASITPAQRAAHLAAARRLARAATGPHQLTAVTFSDRPRLLASAEVLGNTAAESTGETDVATALAFAAGQLDFTRTPRILLISDGRPTRGDAPAVAAWLARRRVQIDVLAAPGESAPAPNGEPDGDLGITALTAPQELRPQAPFPVTVSVAGTGRDTGRARVTLSRAAAREPLAPGAPAEPSGAPTPGSEVGTQEVELEAGRATATFTTKLDDSEPVVFRARVARVAPMDGRPDRHPGNDQALLVVAAAPRPRTLLLAAQPRDAETLVRALRAGEIDVEVRRPGGNLARAELERFDLVGFVDLPAAALSDSAVAAVAESVRDGAGLLVTGGAGGLSASDRADTDTRLRALLPVDPEAPERRDEPALALALVVDRSGSMAGAKMELTRQAARATAEALPPDDRIAVIAFDSQASVVVRLQRAANRMRILSDIGRIQPSGGTNILAGLREGVDQLTQVSARKKHLILLSDGQSPAEGIPELVDAAAAAHITISTVAVGEGADQSLLRLVASRGGGRFHPTRDPTEIPRIFSRETSELRTSNLVERPTRMVVRKSAQMLAGVRLDRAPPLTGHVRTRARPGAEILVASSEGDPLLVRWSVGLGQVVAWTSDLGPRWSGALARSADFGKLWAQIARGTMRPHAANRVPVAVRTEGSDRVSVEVDAVTGRDAPAAGLEASVTVRAVAASGAWIEDATRVVPMPEVAPGRYAARFGATSARTPDGTAANRPAALRLEVTLRDEQRRPAFQGAASLSLPLAPEHHIEAPHDAAAATPRDDAAPSPRAHPAVPPTLAELAALTGGRVLSSPEDLFRDAPPTRRRIPLQTPLLLAAAALFVAEMILRRLLTTRPRRSPTDRRAANRPTPPPDSPAAR